MAGNDKIEVDGTVEKVLKGTNFEVALENGITVTASLAGRLRMNKIRILQGDKVQVAISPYDLTKGIVIWRYK